MPERCLDCRREMTGHPVQCRNPAHRSTYDQRRSEAHAAKLSTQIKRASNFEALRDVLSDYFAEQGN